MPSPTGSKAASTRSRTITRAPLLNYDKAVELGDEVFDATYGDVEAYIARGHTFTKEGEYRRAAKDFEKALDLDSNYVNAHCRAAYELGVTWDDEPLHPYDIIRTIRQNAIMNQVSKLIDARRLQQGLPNGLPSSALGMAAYRITAKFYDKSINGPDQIRNEFGQFLEEGEREYEGWTTISYYREIWAMDATDEEIISGMTETLCQQMGDTPYEDIGYGITCGYVDDNYTRFGVFIAVGLGLTDGSAYAVMHINQAREEVGVPRLCIDPSLRAMARKYRPMATIPDEGTLQQDVVEYGYLYAGIRTRHFFSGSHSPFLRDVLPEPGGLSYEDLGKLAADALLKDHDAILLRSDWQDIAVTTSLSSPSSSEGSRVQAEFLIGWRLPEGKERPSHFPPPPERIEIVSQGNTYRHIP